MYSAESLDERVLHWYDIPTGCAPEYAMRFGRGPRQRSENIEYFDPIEHHKEDLSLLAEIAGCPTGLGGSRLVGLSRPASDLDIVLFGPEASASGRKILAVLSEPRQQLATQSTTFARLMRLAADAIPRMSERNIYKGLINWQGKTTKLDIHYAPSTADVAHGSFSGTIEPVTVQPNRITTLCNLNVVDAERRCYFPGFLDCCLPTAEPCRVWLRDHVLSYMLPGDQFSAQGHEYTDSTGLRNLICVNVLALTLSS